MTHSNSNGFVKAYDGRFRQKTIKLIETSISCKLSPGDSREKDIFSF